MLTAGEMPIEQAGDDEFGGIALVLGPSRSTLRQLFLGHLGRRELLWSTSE